MKTTLTQQATQNRLLRRPELQMLIGLSRSSIYARLDPKSSQYDASFPKPIKLGVKTVAWLAADIDRWINARISESKGA
jgi:prophage regulatory protein